MKRLSIFSIAIILVLYSFAQHQNIEFKVESSKLKVDANLSQSYNSQLSTLNSQLSRAYGDTIWYEDFDSTRWSTYGIGEGPVGWQFQDNTGNDYFWGWSNHGPRGAYTSPNSEDIKELQEPLNVVLTRLNELGASCDNGIMLIESDWFNTAEDGNVVSDSRDMDSWVQTPKINVSDLSAFQLSFFQFWRGCCSSSAKFSIFVTGYYNDSNPEASHWTEFSGWGVLGLVGEHTFLQDRHLTFNLTYLAGVDSIVIRFHKSLMSHYYWIIDDILISEPASYDLKMEQAWWDYGQYPNTEIEDYDPDEDWYGGYTHINSSQRNEFVSFRAAVTNIGLMNQENVQLIVNAYYEDSLVYNSASNSIAFEAGERDTLTINEPFVPSMYGDYLINSSIVSNNSDQDTSNNSMSYKFRLDYNYSRNYLSTDIESTNHAESSYEILNGNEVGILYEVNCSRFFAISTISVYIDSYQNEEEIAAIANEDLSIQGILYKLEGEHIESLEPYYYSDEYTLLLSDTNSVVELRLNNFIDDPDDGEYYAAVKFFSNNTNVGLKIKNDMSIQQPINASIIKNHDQWFYSFNNPAISIFVEPADCAASIELIYDASGWPDFDPTIDELFVSMSYDYWTEPGTKDRFKLSYNAADNLFYSETIRMSYACIPIQYQYYKNTGWENPEMDDELFREFVPNCSGIVHYDSYPTSVEKTEEQVFSVYPVPAYDMLTIRGHHQVESIQLYNLVGKEFQVERIQKGGEIKLNVLNLNTGIYFLKINNETHKIIINR